MPVSLGEKSLVAAYKGNVCQVGKSICQQKVRICWHLMTRAVGYGFKSTEIHPYEDSKRLVQRVSRDFGADNETFCPTQ